MNGEGNGLSEKSFILNKVAQLFTYVCMIDYPRRWSLFFDNLVESVTLGPSAVDLYLRVLLAVDGEVVDRDIAHTDQVCCVCCMSLCCLRPMTHVPETVSRNFHHKFNYSLQCQIFYASCIWLAKPMLIFGAEINTPDERTFCASEFICSSIFFTKPLHCTSPIWN